MPIKKSTLQMKITGLLAASIFLLAVLSFTGCSNKIEADYSIESSNFLQANEKRAAEAILKEGLLKYPQSALLKFELFDYYMNTNQWLVAEEYYQTAGAGFSGGERIVAAFAEHYFEAKDWQKAYKYYLDSGLNYQYAESTKSKCPLVALEEFRNAAAAALNMNDSPKIVEAYQKMQLAASKPECTDAQSTKYLAEVKTWLPRNAKK